MPDGPTCNCGEDSGWWKSGKAEKFCPGPRGMGVLLSLPFESVFDGGWLRRYNACYGKTHWGLAKKQEHWFSWR